MFPPFSLLPLSSFPNAYWKADLFCLSLSEMTEFQHTAKKNVCHMLERSGLHKSQTQSASLDTWSEGGEETLEVKVCYIVCSMALASHYHKTIADPTV